MIVSLSVPKLFPRHTRGIPERGARMLMHRYLRFPPSPSLRGPALPRELPPLSSAHLGLAGLLSLS